MLNNFIYAQSKAMFEERIAEVPNEAIVFIEDTKEIWNHGQYFAGEGVNINDFNNLQTSVSQIQADKQNKWTNTALTGSTVTLSSMSENTFYYNNTAITALTISSFASSSEPRGLYKIAIKTSSSGTTISLPSTVYWANGAIPEIVADTYYELSIERSCGVYKAILVPFNQVA